MKTLIVAGLILVSMSSYADQSLYEAINNGRDCWFDDNRGFTCKFEVGNDLKFMMVDIGGSKTMTLIEKADYENGKYHLRVSSDHNCLMVADRASELFNDFAYISPINAKIYRRSCSNSGEETPW